MQRHSGVIISQFRACGPNGEEDDFVELFNAGKDAVQIGGWQLRVSQPNGRISTTLNIAGGTILAAGQYFLAANANQYGYSGVIKPDQIYTIGVPSLGGVALIRPEGDIADQVGFDKNPFREGETLQMTAPISRSAPINFARKAWAGVVSCADTDNNRADFDNIEGNSQHNSTMAVTPCREFAAWPFFHLSIVRPTKLISTLDPFVIATNVLLALLLALLLGFFSNLLNDTLESNEESIQQMFVWLRAPIVKLQNVAMNIHQWFVKRNLTFVSQALHFTLILLLSGLIYAFLDPSFSLIRSDAIALISTAAIAVGLVAIADDLAQLAYLRRKGESGVVKIHTGNTLLAMVTMMISRGFGLAPGILAGSPAGIEGVRDSRHEVRSHIWGLWGIGALAGVAWLLSGVTSDSSLLTTILLLIFANGVQNIFFELVPLRFLHGKSIYQADRKLWLAMFGISTFVFLQTMLNPDGAFISAFIGANMAALTFWVVAFCLLCVLIWLYFQRRSVK